MTPQEAIAFFGSQVALAEALGIKQPSVAEWVRNGAIPWPRQFQIQHVSNGGLVAEPVDPKSRSDGTESRDTQPHEAQA